MTNRSKTLLAVSVGGLTVGSAIVFGNFATHNVGLLMAMPLGAVASGSVLIFHMLGKEMNQFDREEAEKRAAMERPKAKQVPGRLPKTPPAPLALQGEIL